MKMFLRRHAPGTVPGPLAVTEPPQEPGRARYTEYRLDTLVEADLDDPDEIPEATAELTQWLDVEGHDATLIKQFGQRLVLSDLRFRLDRRFHQEDIVIAFPQRDVHLDSAHPLRVQVIEEPHD